MTTKLAQVLDAQGRRRDWLAAQTGVSAPLVTLIAQGKRRPSDEFKKAAAAALDVPVETLFPAKEAAA